MNKNLTSMFLSILLLFWSAAISPQIFGAIVINEIYPSGGAASATYNRDYIELYNNGASSINISGYSIQTTNTSGTPFIKCDITASDTVIEAGTYFLIQFGTSNSAVGSAIPTPDATCGTNIPSSASKIVLVSNTTLLDATTCVSSGTPIVDFVGFGSVNCSETQVASAPANNQSSIQRTPTGTDNNNNSTDFQSGIPTPQNATQADLTINQTDSPDPVLVGNTVTYTLTVSNIGSVNATNIAVNFALPTGVSVTFNSASGTNGFIGTLNGSVVNFTGGTIAAGTTATLTVVVTPTTSGTMTSTGTGVIVDPSNTIAESNDSNNIATTITTTVNVVTAASATVGGRVTEANGRGIFRARVTLIDSQGIEQTAYTNTQGYYSFPDVPGGQTYILAVRHLRYQFAVSSFVEFIDEDNPNINFVSIGESLRPANRLSDQ